MRRCAPGLIPQLSKFSRLLLFLIPLGACQESGSKEIPSGTLPECPINPRGGATSVWTGKKLLLWGGGLKDESTAFNDGAAYDPAQRKWSALATSPLSPRSEHCAVWTGTVMIVHGGGINEKYDAEGAAYDPETDRWKSIARGPQAARGSAKAVWTGHRMIVWGGWKRTGGLFVTQKYFNDGAMYDPKTDTWTSMSKAPIAGRTQFAMAWSGKKLLVWGGYTSSGTDSTFLGDGAEYDPDSNAWTRLPDAPLESRQSPSGIWMDNQFVIWGGAQRNHSKFYSDGAAFKEGAWTRLPPSPLAGRYGTATIMAEGKFFVWGGYGAADSERDLLPDGAVFDGKSWSMLPKTTVSARCYPAAAFSGSKLIIWGGYDGEWNPVWSGGELETRDR